MSFCTANVRFQGLSGHDLLRESAFAVANGAKRTLVFAAHMSADDPKLTLEPDIARTFRNVSAYDPTETLGCGQVRLTPFPAPFKVIVSHVGPSGKPAKSGVAKLTG